MALAASLPLRAAESLDAADLLRSQGLTLVDRVWLAPLEVQLRGELDALPKRRERIVTLERQLEDRIEANARSWQAAQPTIAALKQALDRLGTDDVRRDAIQSQIEALQASVAEPARLSARPPVRTQVVAWNSERSALAVALARIRQAAAQLQDVYDRLAQSREMLEAIARLGEGYRLGPQRSYRADLDRLAEYERLAYTRWTPVYWHGSRLRFTALIADRSPITFSWTDSPSEPATMTHTAAEAAGIAVPAEAPHESLPLEGDRKVTARRIVLPKLRIGGVVLRDVSVLVLPPEAEDVGCRLGRQSLSGLPVRVEPERLRLWVDAG